MSQVPAGNVTLKGNNWREMNGRTIDRLGRFKKPTRNSAAPKTGHNGKQLLPLAMAGVGGWLEELDFHQRKTIWSQAWSGWSWVKITQPSPSSCLWILLGTYNWSNPTGNQRQKGEQLTESLEISLQGRKPGWEVREWIWRGKWRVSSPTEDPGFQFHQWKASHLHSILGVSCMLWNIENIIVKPRKEHQVIRHNFLCCRKAFSLLLFQRCFIVGNATEMVKDSSTCFKLCVWINSNFCFLYFLK